MLKCSYPNSCRSKGNIINKNLQVELFKTFEKDKRRLEVGGSVLHFSL